MTTDMKRLAATGILAFALGAWALPVLAVASLEGRTLTGGRVDAYDSNAVMIYDPNADLTWLRDWNVNGAKPWVDQLVWASNLQMGTFANWSLPTARNQDGSDPCFGFNCTGSQMGYLWYQVLGNTGSGFTNAGPFQNLQSSMYWSGTEYAPNPNYAWYFGASVGSQGIFPPPKCVVCRGCAPRRCGRPCAGATDVGDAAAGLGRGDGGLERAARLRL